MNVRMVRAMIAATVLATGVAPMMAFGQTGMDGENQRTIRVSGMGQATAVPDLATVEFAVETTGATAQEAGQTNADAMQRVIAALRAAGVGEADIRTSGYGIYPEYETPSRQMPEADPLRIRGYRATNQVSVKTTDLDGIGRLIDVGLQAGANRMHGVRFELRNSAAAEAAALEDAVGKARAAAETMARALGVRLGAVLDASTSSQPPQPMYRMAAQDMSREVMQMAAPPTPIEVGEQTIHAVASLVFAIE